MKTDDVKQTRWGRVLCALGLHKRVNYGRLDKCGRCEKFLKTKR